jgi:hypothetical protein
MNIKILSIFLGLLVLGLAIGVAVMQFVANRNPEQPVSEYGTELPEGVVYMEEVVEQTPPEVPTPIVVDEIDPESTVPMVKFN